MLMIMMMIMIMIVMQMQLPVTGMFCLPCKLLINSSTLLLMLLLLLVNACNKLHNFHNLQPILYAQICILLSCILGAALVAPIRAHSIVYGHRTIFM